MSVSELDTISRTCLGPVVARARESQRHSGVLHDPKSVEVTRRLGLDEDLDVPPEYHLAIVVRTQIVDEATLAFMARHPGGVVVNLGAGLDTRFCRLNNGVIRWFELDVPAVIELRRRLFAEHGRYRTIAGSVLQAHWMDEIPFDGPTLFIMEGLMNYLGEEDARNLVRRIAQRFPRAEIVMEALGLFYVRLVNQPLYQWGACAENSPARWDPKLQLNHLWYVTDRYPERWAEFRWMGPLLVFKEGFQVIFDLRVKRQDGRRHGGARAEIRDPTG